MIGVETESRQRRDPTATLLAISENIWLFFSSPRYESMNINILLIGLLLFLFYHWIIMIVAYHCFLLLNNPAPISYPSELGMTCK